MFITYYLVSHPSHRHKGTPLSHEILTSYVLWQDCFVELMDLLQIVPNLTLYDQVRLLL